MLDWKKGYNVVIFNSMLFPHPESDFSLNIMVIASDILRLLVEKGRPMLEEDAMSDFLKKDKRRTPEMFINCATFLFALGYIEHVGYRLMVNKELLQRPKNNQQLSLVFGEDA